MLDLLHAAGWSRVLNRTQINSRAVIRIDRRVRDVGIIRFSLLSGHPVAVVNVLGFWIRASRIQPLRDGGEIPARALRAAVGFVIAVDGLRDLISILVLDRDRGRLI